MIQPHAHNKGLANASVQQLIVVLCFYFTLVHSDRFVSLNACLRQAPNRYTDINSNWDDSVVVQTSKRSDQFFLRKLLLKIDVEELHKQQEIAQVEEVKSENKIFHERDLSLNSQLHFKLGSCKEV